MIVRSKATKRNIVVQRYDTDYVETNSLAQKKKSQNLVKSDLMAMDNWNFNEWNTKEDVYSDLYHPSLKKLPSDKNRMAGGLRSHNW